MKSAPSNHLRQRKRIARVRRRGATIVESALVLSTLMLLVMGILDVGIAVIQYNALSDAARRLARRAITHGAMAGPEHELWGPTAFDATAAGAGPIPETVRPWLTAMHPSEVDVTVEWIDGGHEPDQRVRVSLRHRHQYLAPWLLGGGDLPLEATSVMRIAH